VPFLKRLLQEKAKHTVIHCSSSSGTHTHRHQARGWRVKQDTRKRATERTRERTQGETPDKSKEKKRRRNTKKRKMQNTAADLNGYEAAGRSELRTNVRRNALQRVEGGLCACTAALLVKRYAPR
jgi:hypothetical protein